MENQQKKKDWKQWLLHEFNEYWINAAYMALFFCSVIMYRRLVLAEYGIILDDYFVGVLKALVIAKVVMIGAFLRISKKFENKPLIIPTIYKAVLFTLWVMIFDIAEIYIKALIKTGQFKESVTLLEHHLNAAWLGAAFVICVSFLPFFAMKEMSRTMGSEKFRGLFFKNR
jgi:hypothetical protein